MSNYAEIKKDADLRVSASQFVSDGEIRISAFGGGPDGMELIIKMDIEGEELTVWNPFKRKWEVLVDTHLTR